MEIDLTMVLPEFDGLASISAKARKTIEDAHRKLTELAGVHRRAAFNHGRLFAKIRDTLDSEGQGESWAAYCRAVDINPQTFRDCIYIFEAFGQEHFELLQMFPLTVQRLISRPSMRHLLPQAFELAEASEEVTRSWLDNQNGVSQQKKMPPPDDDLDDDEDRDIDRYLGGNDDDDEQDAIPIERRKEFKDALRNNDLAIEDPETVRDQLCEILIGSVQEMKKRLSIFVNDRKIWGGHWYRNLEEALDEVVERVKDLQVAELIRTGE